MTIFVIQGAPFSHLCAPISDSVSVHLLLRSRVFQPRTITAQILARLLLSTQSE